MFKSEKNAITETPTSQDVSLPNLTHTALGIARNTKTSDWCVVEISFNPETGETGNLLMFPAGPMKEMAVEQFKINAVKKELV